MPPASTYEWRSLSYAADFFGRSVITIRHWCADGMFLTASIATYKDTRGRWWIALPPSGNVSIPADDRLQSPSA